MPLSVCLFVCLEHVCPKWSLYNNVLVSVSVPPSPFCIPIIPERQGKCHRRSRFIEKLSPTLPNLLEQCACSLTFRKLVVDSSPLPKYNTHCNIARETKRSVTA